MKNKIQFLLVLVTTLWVALGHPAFAEEPTPAAPAASSEAPAPAPPAPEAEATVAPKAAPAVSFESLLEARQLPAFKTDHGIERSDLAAGYLLLKAEEAMGEGRLSDAERLGEMAVEFSPDSPLPQFFLSRLAWDKNKTDLPGVVKHYLAALRLGALDFWFAHAVVGTALVLVLSALLLNLLTFILYSLFTYSPLWIHRICEGSRGYFHPLFAWFIFVAILVVPFLLGLSIFWFVLFSFLLFWGFYSRSEKVAALALLAVLGTLTWSLPFLFTFFTAKSDLPFNELIRYQQRDFFWSPPRLDVARTDGRGTVVDAAYHTQEGDYGPAELLYQKILVERPGSVLALNNLGNLAFYRKEYPKAVSYYKQAIAASPGLVSAHYNMSLAYREMLSFEEGTKEYNVAKGLDAGKVEEYTRKSVLFPTLPLIDERFDPRALWRETVIPNAAHLSAAEKIWQGMAGDLPLKRSPLIALCWLLILALSPFLLGGLYNASFCVICRKALCSRCQRTVLSYRVCGQCGTQFKSIKKSDLALLEGEEKKVQRRLFPFFLLPGGGHLVMKKAGTGFIFLLLFYFVVSYLWLGEILFSSTQWHLDGARSIGVPLALFILYALSTLDLLRIWSKQTWL
ncbi:MAG: tetratricopeptide repeat protein [Nitrospirae bacterium]|nr:tetratricopeptide repeat protein [Candidatus Manganitrophaceae bacterium]